jgi:hypothetical protein
MPKSQPSDPRPPPSLPLSGLRVLDFGIGGVGVEAGRMFAEYGADVIKMESQTYPDFIRVVMGTELSPSYASSSRSKRSFGVNVKKPDGFAIAKRLIESCDVLIENSKTGAMEGMGIGWEKIREWNLNCGDGEQPAASARAARGGDWIGYGLARSRSAASSTSGTTATRRRPPARPRSSPITSRAGSPRSTRSRCCTRASARREVRTARSRRWRW